MKKSLQSFTLTLLFVFNIVIVNAQNFSFKTNNKALTFKEMQNQFAAFKKQNDLSKQKYWKHFKRYEADMQLHTNAIGEPSNFESYLEDAILVSKTKNENESNASIWNPIGPNYVPNNLTGYMENGIGRVNCVAFHPTDTNTFYVGVAQGGVWKTTNGGQTYAPLTDNLPITRVSDICIDPNDPNTIYISLCDFEYIGKGLFYDGKKRNTHYGLGIYKSTNAGLTWSPTGLAFQTNQSDVTLMRKIIVNPSNSNELLACGVSGMYRSNNGGTTWTKKLDSLFWDMEQDALNPNTIYAASGWVKNTNTGYAGIYKSTDFGNTWALLNTGIPFQGTVQRIKLAIAPSNHNCIYALTCDNVDGLYSVLTSTNGGNSWLSKFPVDNILEWDQGSNPGGQGTYDMALIVDKLDAGTIYTGGINLWGSSDSANTFNPISHWTYNFGTSTIHADIHAICRQPISNALFVCSDGGICKTNKMQIASWGTQWPTNWINLSDGMQSTSFYRVSNSKDVYDRIVAGAQDNGSFYYNGLKWSTIFGGDGMDNYLDPINHQDILGSSQYGNYFYSNDDGQSGTFVNSNPNNENAEWTTPIVADYNHHGVLYIGNENVVKSIDGGLNWTPLASIFSNTSTSANTEISALAVANSNSNTIYVTRRVRYEFNLKGIVFKTTNGGNTFTNITNNLPDSLYYTSIDVHPNDANEAVVCMAGFANGCKVFRTTNGGQTWANISYNLPNIPINCIKYIPVSNQIVIASDLGIYNLVNNTWILNSSGLPNVIVTDIEFNPSLNKVYISTFGRGLWESTLSSLSILGINDLKANHTLDFEIYPSINQGKFNVETLTNQTKVDCKIYDVCGRIVFQQVLEEKTNLINLSVKSGCYYVKLSNNQGLIGVKKIIVE